MEDIMNKQAEQTQTTEMPGTETPTPDEKSDRDELKPSSFTITTQSCHLLPWVWQHSWDRGCF
jgi:hypothetical protein